MEIHHHGATTGVTGSCHELQLTTGPGFLIDCGLFQGAETATQSAHEGLQEIDFPITHIKALIVTHVHIDHIGRIPHLLSAGFKGPIYCSEPSAILLPLVLEDALKVGFTKNKQLIQRVLKRIKQQTKPLPYKHFETIHKGQKESVQIKFTPAGHILGSAYVTFRVKETKQQTDVLFSGDLGAPYTPLLAAPKSPYKADIVILESTYGDRIHQNRRERQQNLKKIIENSLRNSGTILIPAFSIGRTQELLYEFESIIQKQKERKTSSLNWEKLQIIVDSPLASRFTETYKQLKPYWDKEARTRIRRGRHPLSFEQLITVNTHRQHERMVSKLKENSQPAIVIAASGMCSGGRIQNYLKALIEDQRTDIVFVGYQATGTPGRIIQQYGPRNGYVTLDGDRYTINATIHTASGYSAHADQQDLINFIKRIRIKPETIRLIHGDPEAKKHLQNKLNGILKNTSIIIP